MKKFLYALIAALLIAAPLASPAAAQDPCGGTTYIVQPKDNLSKIAALCRTTVEDLLKLNPQIADPNLIFSGQVLRISGAVSSTVSYTGSYIVRSGDTVASIAEKFGVSILAMKQANPELWYNSVLTAGQSLKIPVPGYRNSSGGPHVTISATTAARGDEIKVYVSGFPANAWIDYRVGEEGEDYTDVYDGTVKSNGTATAFITIPNEADEGEYWVVIVATTGQVNGVEATSARIYIDN